MNNELSTSSSTESAIHISRRAVFALATTIIITFGSIGAAYYSNRPDDRDRFYGWQGDALTKNHEALKNEVATIKLVVNDFQQTKPQTLRRIDHLEIITEQHHVKFDKHLEWDRQMVQQFAVEDAKIQSKLNECLTRTGVRK